MLQSTLSKLNRFAQITNSAQGKSSDKDGSYHDADDAAPARLLIKNSCAAAHDAGACIIAEHVKSNAGGLLRWTQRAAPADGAGMSAEEAEVYGGEADELEGERILQR